MGWAIPKRPDASALTRHAGTKPRKGGDLESVFPLGGSVQVPGENSPAGRAVLYESVPGFGRKASVRLPFLFS